MKRRMEVCQYCWKFVYLQTFWYKYICCMSPILFFIIFFTCTGVGKIFLQINSAAVAFINIIIAAWEGLNSILMMSYKFPSNLHISPIFNGLSMQVESKWNTEGRQFKWSLLNTTIGTIYHKSMERNLKKIPQKNILFKCKWNWFKMHFFLLRENAKL